MRVRLLFLVLGLALGCGGAREAKVGPSTLPGSDGEKHAVPPVDPESRFTVLVFISKDCEIVAAHEQRLNALARELDQNGVDFFAIDSEVDAALAEHRGRSERLGFPVLLDSGARLAKAAGAKYSGYAVVIDRTGELRYRGGIDSDRTALHADREPYLENALRDLLAERPVRRVEAPAFGCSLRTF